MGSVDNPTGASNYEMVKNMGSVGNPTGASNYEIMKSMGGLGNSAMPLQLGALNPVINSNSSGTVN